MFDDFEFCLRDADTCGHLKDFVENGRLEMWLKDLRRDGLDFESYYRAMKKVIDRRAIDNPPALAAWYMRDGNWEKLERDAAQMRVRASERERRETSPFIPGRIFCRNCDGRGWYAVKEHRLSAVERGHVDFKMKMDGTACMTSSRNHYVFQCACQPKAGPRKEGDGVYYDPLEKEASRGYGKFLRSAEGADELSSVMKGFGRTWNAIPAAAATATTEGGLTSKAQLPSPGLDGETPF